MDSLEARPVNILQEAQLMLTYPNHAFRGQSRSPNIVPFHMLGIVSSCAIVTLPFRRAGFPVFDIKNVVTLKSGSGHSRSLKVVPPDRLRMISCWCSIVTLSRFWDIRLQKCRDLDNWVTGLSMSLEMSSCDTAHTTSYWRSIVTMALSCVVSEIFNVEKCCHLEIGFRGHSRSLKVVPFDRLCMVSY